MHIASPRAGVYRPGPEGTAMAATAGAQSFLAIDTFNDLHVTANRLNRYIVQIDCSN